MAEIVDAAVSHHCIFRINGTVLGLSILNANTYACTVEMPLEKLCLAGNANLFDVTGEQGKIKMCVYTCTCTVFATFHIRFVYDVDIVQALHLSRALLKTVVLILCLRIVS